MTQYRTFPLGLPLPKCGLSFISIRRFCSVGLQPSNVSLLQAGTTCRSVNQKVLIQQLKEMEKDGISTRTIYPLVPLRFEYALSEIGLALGPSIEALINWTFMRRKAKAQARSG
jgi:DNA-binding HxlR family transcriptional regulator